MDKKQRKILLNSRVFFFSVFRGKSIIKISIFCKTLRFSPRFLEFFDDGKVANRAFERHFVLALTHRLFFTVFAKIDV